ISTSANQQGSAGNITLVVGQLTATGGANISSRAAGAAPAGQITITAEGVLLSGRNPTDASKPSGILSLSPQSAVSGDISLVNVASLSVTDGAAIQSGSGIAGAGGSVTVSSRGPVVVSSGGSITSQARGADVREVTIKAPSSSLTIDNGLVQASTIEAGKAGDVTVKVATLSVTGGGAIK